MFQFKKLFLMFCVSAVAFIGAMDKNYLAEQSNEMKVGVIFAIPFVTDNLQQAALTINALVRSCNGFCQIINDEKVTKDLVKVLLVKFGGYHEAIARVLATKGAQEYITSHTNVLKMCHKLLTFEATVQNTLETIVQKARSLLDSMGDIGFTDRNGESVLCHMIIPRHWAWSFLNQNSFDVDAHKKSCVNFFTYVFNYGKQQGVTWHLNRLMKYAISLRWNELGILLTQQMDKNEIVSVALLIMSETPTPWIMGGGGIVYDAANDPANLFVSWSKQARQDKQ